MGSFSDYWEDKILDHLFGQGAYTPPTIYVGLSTADPADDGSGLAEPSGGGYARVATAAADWNAGDIEFPQATANWGTVTHFALFDAATEGHLLAHGALTVAKPVTSGDPASIPAGELSASLN